MLQHCSPIARRCFEGGPILCHFKIPLQSFRKEGFETLKSAIQSSRRLPLRYKFISPDGSSPCIQEGLPYRRVTYGVNESAFHKWFPSLTRDIIEVQFHLDAKSLKSLKDGLVFFIRLWD
ncbi:hypothetical protein CDAR_43131 [Caerostris darwini]|uniref:Uncharacterized protein n=1 Tax=Caerostris darwini TaxID=1538125 RepID=A0AAV4WIQ7_9ARAC|nr:hypothetical protein CDAR_43131 [Caerostris darwini]